MATTTTSKLRRAKTTFDPTPLPEWQSPRVPQPADAITPPEAKLNVLERAKAIVGVSAAPEILAAVILAEAFDRLAAKLVEAAAVNRYHHGS